MFFFSKGIMVKSTVLRGVAVMEDKDEILFDPSRRYYCWYQKMVFPDSKKGSGCWRKQKHEIFLIHYFAL